MNFKKFFLVLATFISVVFFLGCASKNGAGENALQRDLENTISAYYQLEMNNHWKEAYEIRNPNFHHAIGKHEYQISMQKDNSGWKLIKYQISDIKMNGSIAVVKIEFIESVPSDFAKNFNLPESIRQMSFTEVTEWVRIDGKWYSNSAGVRGHLPLNNPLAPE